MQGNNWQKQSPAKRIALSSALLGIIIALTAFEHTLPPIPFLPPGARLGLGNVALMYSMFFVSLSNAFLLGALKALFVFASRGALAGAMSFAGGMASLGGMALANFVFKGKPSYLALSVLGAFLHNTAQITLASVINKTNLLMPYLPYIAISSIIFGTATGVTLAALMPRLKKILKGG